MPELLLELFSEEIPARMQTRAADDLKRLVTEKLKAAQLAFASAEAFATPRRLALVVRDLPEAQPDLKEERRGPRADAPQKAIDGFLKGAGVTLADCEKRDTGKGVFLFAAIERRGRPTREVLPGLLREAIVELPWPKSMRWGGRPERWVRPLHSILCLFSGRVVPVEFAGLTAGDATRGHRFHAPEPFGVSDFSDYRHKLADAGVLLDGAARRQRIVEAAGLLAEEEGLTVAEDPGLLDELAGLVERPVPLLGSIDARFMALPPEVLTTSMRTHQKYLSLRAADGALAPRFVFVANLEAEDGGAQIVAGNERVLKARLSDAEYFWESDRKTRLEARVPALADIVFHARLGTVGEKVARLQTLAAELAPYVPGADAGLCRRAALLAKADLTTGMVGEFPELQGVMGRYYALAEGEKAQVADAIAQHYAPRGPDDACPAAPTAVVVALADKLDTLVGFWSIDEKPTGSKDPFALRRAALGVIRLIVENGLRIRLLPVFTRAMEFAREADAAKRREEANRPGHGGGVVSVMYGGSFGPTATSLLDFFADRLKVHLREKGVRHDLVQAVFALGGEDDLVRLLARVDALDKFLKSDDGANLLTAYRRAVNIVRIEEKKGGWTDGPVDPARLKQAEEAALANALGKAEAEAGTALAAEDFAAAMTALAALRRPVDAFFDKVTVNAPETDLRENRLRLLSAIRAVLHRVADFGQIEG